MLRSFCVGALIGFLFGSSKKGHDLREGIDGFLTDLTSTETAKMIDEKKDEMSEIASRSFAKLSTNKKNGKYSQSPEKMESADSASDRPSRAGDKKETEESSAAPQPKLEKQNFEPQSQDDAEDMEPSGAPALLDVDKAQELADKLGAKPSAPEDENLTAFKHSADDELKSA